MNKHVTFSAYQGKTVFTINTPDGAVHVIGCQCFDHLGEAYKAITDSQAPNPVVEAMKEQSAEIAAKPAVPTTSDVTTTTESKETKA